MPSSSSLATAGFLIEHVGGCRLSTPETRWSFRRTCGALWRRGWAWRSVATAAPAETAVVASGFSGRRRQFLGSEPGKTPATRGWPVAGICRF
nr:hypothetical protein Iba_chr01cCG5230 [Ipomoea batatas]GMC51331.1 hypothetical protein Iba_chr01cCG5250 [Ipomoea batatas]